ncbi:putative glycosyltransferase [Methanocella paludicola SANAE]|uniref:Glycosyltransferase n=2 Tax=Methanocella TaxID=570266 RepID=D1Z1P7_METPS|nr:putative glycosyltransferase [Methanocella paludicola SANAE]
MGIMVAIPAYNEEIAIGSVVAKCKKYSNDIVVIDDGSRDHTIEVARIVGAEVISHEKNGGYGAAIRSCFEAARARGVSAMITIDGDGQHDPDNIPLLIAEMNRTGADVIIGSRFINGNEKNQHIPAYRKVGMKMLDMATIISSGVKVTDTQSGFRAYSKKALSEIDLEDAGMGIGSEILIKAAKLKLHISEVPIRARYDIKDTSSKNPVAHGIEVLASIARFSSRSKLQLFYGLLGLILLVLGSYLAFSSITSDNLIRFIVIMVCMVGGTLGVFTALVIRTFLGIAPRASKLN